METKMLRIGIFLTFISSLLFSQENLTTGIGTGSGTSVNEALRNAIQNGIEKAVGVFLVGETYVENYQLQYNKILTYSNALINKYEILESHYDSSTKVHKRKVKVYVSDQLLNYTYKINNRRYKVDSENLYARTSQKFEMIDNAKKMLKNYRYNYFNSAWNITLSQESIQEDYQSKTVIIKYDLDAKCENQFYYNLFNFLKLFNDPNSATNYIYVNSKYSNKTGIYSNPYRFDRDKYINMFFVNEKLNINQIKEIQINPKNFDFIKILVDKIGFKPLMYFDWPYKAEKQGEFYIENNKLNKIDTIKLGEYDFANWFLNSGIWTEYTSIHLLPEIKEQIYNELSKITYQFKLRIINKKNIIINETIVGEYEFILNMEDYFTKKLPTFKNSKSINFKLKELQDINVIECIVEII